MENLKQLKLSNFEERALLKLKEKIIGKFPKAEIILFGSKVRGDFGLKICLLFIILLR